LTTTWVDECLYRYQLEFKSSESLRRIVGDLSLDEVLNELGVSGRSGLFRIEVEDGGEELNFPGWVSWGDGEGEFHLTLVRHLS
jgi:hypothetical protein